MQAYIINIIHHKNTFVLSLKWFTQGSLKPEHLQNFNQLLYIIKAYGGLCTRAHTHTHMNARPLSQAIRYGSYHKNGKALGMSMIFYVPNSIIRVAFLSRYNAMSCSIGAIQVLRNAFFLKLDPHPTPRNANNIEPYTFVTLFPRKLNTPH